MLDVNHPALPRSSRRPRLLRAAAVFGLAWALAGAPGARAQDASFGCKVLLCAAATAPGWTGIPYCVPVMQQLIRQLTRGGAWPVCLEGQAPASASPPPSQAAGDGQAAAPRSDVTAGP